MKFRAQAIASSLRSWCGFPKRWISRAVPWMSKKQIWAPMIPTLVVIGVIIFAIEYWGWLRGYVNGVPPSPVESPSTTIRNIALGLMAFLALAIASWRGWVANQQADTAKQQLLNERYQKATEMLGSDVMVVRLGGVYQLQRLAREYPQQYHVLVTQTLCRFVRQPTTIPISQGGTGDPVPSAYRQDVLAAIEAMQDRVNLDRLSIERSAKYCPDLGKAELRGADLYRIDLTGMRLDGADLSGANLFSAILISCSMYETNLSDATMEYADLTNSRLLDTNFLGAHLWGTKFDGALLHNTRFSNDDGHRTARGLTQSQLDAMQKLAGSPGPVIKGVLDAMTGEPLTWE